MKSNKGRSNTPVWVLVITIVWILAVATGAAAQVSRASQVSAGTVIQVRTNEEIETSDNNGDVFSGTVENNVLGRNGRVAIPRGSEVELVVKETADENLVLDLDSVNINGRRYAITSEGNVTEEERRDGIGVNKRTGKYVGGGAVIGAIIGGITGGKKGAAIGAGAGAAAGAGAQVLTRGPKIDVPAESLLTFRLTQPIRTTAMQSSFNRDDRRYYDAYPDRAQGRFTPGAGGSVAIGGDNNITWQGPENSRVFVEVDNHRRQLFAAGRSGTQAAPWIEPGHVYVFTLVDANGVEVARDRLDLRQRRYR